MDTTDKEILQQAFAIMARMVDREAAAMSAQSEAGQTARFGRLCATYLEIEKLRSDAFGDDFQNGPGWKLLLVLYKSYALAEPRTVQQATREAGLSGATGVRWIGILKSKGLLSRAADAHDGRKSWISLTPLAIAAMDKCIAAEYALLRAGFL